MTLGKEVRVFRSVDAIGRETINSIAGDAFFTYEWFKTLETQKSFDQSPIYFVAYHEGKVVAVAPCFIELLDQPFFYDIRRAQVNTVAPFLRQMLLFGLRLGFYQQHVLICYSPVSFRTKVLIESTCIEKKHILNLLTNKIDAFCKNERILFSSFRFVSEFDQLLIGNLPDFGYVQSSSLTNFYLDVRWPSFKAYLKSVNYKYRKDIKREIKKFEENGITIEELEFEDIPAYVSELASNLYLKYNYETTSYSSFFNKLTKYAKDRVKIFIAKKNDAVVGFSLNLRQGDILDTCFAGFKYDNLTSTDFIHFNVCYYAPIRWAIDEGIKKINYRWGQEKIKLYRGCKPEKTYSFVKCHDELLGPLINNGALRIPLYSILEPKRTLRRTLRLDES